MSINSAMLAGVTGLTANASALAAVSDNIANMNTVGYKQEVTNFSDLVTAQATADYSAGGVQAITSDYVTQQGTLQSTTSATDLAISGNGFFVTTQSPTGNSSTDARLFTRAGSFTVNSQGYLENAAGLYLQGWTADSSGNITTDPSNISSLQSINVSALGGTAGATTAVTANANLDASQTISQASTDFGTTATDAYDPTSTTTSMAAYNATTGTGTKPDFTVTVPISDSQGGQRTLQINMLKSAGSANTWYAEAVVVPASDVTTGSGLIDGQVSTGTLSFNSDGTLNTANSTLFGMSSSPTGAATLDIGASNASAPGAGQVNWSSGLGISGQDITLNLGGTASGGLTQFDSDSTTQSVSTNGTPFGNLSSISINDQGLVTAAYDNGVTRTIAQVAVATFQNPDGLTPVSGDAYKVSLSSGTYTLQQAGEGGAGTISPDSLESSTVDLSQQFSNLITTQQAYSASSKIITTADQMLQDLIDIIR